MDTIIFGNGHLGRAIAGGLIARGEPAPTVLGRPGPGGHDPVPADRRGRWPSRRHAETPCYANVAAAIDAGCRRFVIGTTGWDDDVADVATLLARHRRQRRE